MRNVTLIPLSESILAWFKAEKFRTDPAHEFHRVHDRASDCLADHFDFDDQIEIGCGCIDSQIEG